MFGKSNFKTVVALFALTSICLNVVDAEMAGKRREVLQADSTNIVCEIVKAIMFE